MRLLFALLVTIISSTLLSQEKKKIDHTTYNEWKSIRTVQISENGQFIVYDSAPLEGDAVLYLYDVKSGKTSPFSRGKNPKLFESEKAIVFAVEPQFDSIRKLKLADTPKDKLPKDSLFIYYPALDSTQKFAGIKSFSISETGNKVGILYATDKRPDCPKEEEKKKKKKKKGKACTKIPTSGTTLAVLNIDSGYIFEIHAVTNYVLSEDGNKLIYTQSTKGKKDTLSLFLYSFNDSTTTSLIEKQYGITQISFNKTADKIAFLATNDTNENKNYSLYYHANSSDLTGCIVDSMNQSMPEGWGVSEFGRVYFDEAGDRLFFGTNKLVAQEPEDTLLETEMAKVDVWGSNDLRIQPQQLSELNSDKKRSFLSVYYLSEKKMVQLANDSLYDIQIDPQSNSNLCLAKKEEPYMREFTWEYPWKADYYTVNLNDGTSSALLKNQGYRISLAPSGEKVVYYNGGDSCWYAVNTSSQKVINLTDNLNDLFSGDNNGNPSVPDEQGFVGWTLHENEEYVLVNSRQNIWMLHPSDPAQSKCISCGINKNATHRFDYYRLDYDSLYTSPAHNFLIAVNETTKSESIYKMESKNLLTPVLLLETNHKINQILKADNSSQIVLRRMSFIEYPDLELTDISFQNMIKISSINPQQTQYNWGTVEMTSWKSYEGRSLRGLLYKPENFDSTKHYPMIVYFYEKYTDDIHLYYAPKPTASIVYPTEYVSNGYIIFIPDIEYTPGYPAKSAYDCIVSGTDYLIRKYSWIDSTRLGLQGQSWGGYQTAQLITMTGKYKAAMAGAPVSNMISAYGGIRWGAGISRMFQYEKTQSRIGYTIWERPDLYMQNSPLFGLPKVTTPLLIMSNDGDGAVPWYQGIELYMGLRRLGKPVWLLNYNDDEHNLTQLANKRDLSIRMRQFFDYYLLGAPMPVWMSEGVPAIDKGINYGFELENSGN